MSECEEGIPDRNGLVVQLMQSHADLLCYVLMLFANRCYLRGSLQIDQSQELEEQRLQQRETRHTEQLLHGPLNHRHGLGVPLSSQIVELLHYFHAFSFLPHEQRDKQRKRGILSYAFSGKRWCGTRSGFFGIYHN